VAGALIAAAAELLAAGLLVLQERLMPIGAPRPLPTTALYRAWLAGGGWAWIPLWGAAIGLAAAAWRDARGGRRAIQHRGERLGRRGVNGEGARRLPQRPRRFGPHRLDGVLHTALERGPQADAHRRALEA